jgi:hypothetical protein
VAPVFASNAEALAAATEAYAAYQRVVDQILHEGGEGPERIRAVATDPLASLEESEYTVAREQDLHTTGIRTFDGVRLQRVDARGQNETHVVTVYLCSDVSETDVVDATGASIVQTDRAGRTAYEVSFDWSTPGTKGLVVSERTAWNRPGVC